MNYENELLKSHERAFNVLHSIPKRRLEAMRNLIGSLLERGASFRDAKKALQRKS